MRELGGWKPLTGGQQRGMSCLEKNRAKKGIRLRGERTWRYVPDTRIDEERNLPTRTKTLKKSQKKELKA